MHFLPVLIMVESFGAAIVYAWCRQWGSAIYWLAAGILQYAVIFGIKQFG